MFVDVKMVISRPIVPQFICLGLVILTVWQIGVGVVSFFSLDKAVSVRHDPLVERLVPPQREQLSTGLKVAFFGDYVPTNLNEAGVKQSMLDLKVVGIMFSENDEASHVIIQMAAGRERTFKVGDSLPGGGIIKRITPDGVLIGRNGSLESLSLPKKALISAPPPKPLESSN